jgi:NAD dependent epimerase/dehydratase family enzyme
MRCLIDDPAAVGPFNLVAPGAATNAEFSRALGRAMHRPAIFPVPALAVRLLYGEMGDVVLNGHRAIPKRLEERDFTFRFPDVDEALNDLLG